MNYESFSTDQLLEALPHNLHVARNDNAESHDRWRIYNSADDRFIEPGAATVRALLVSTMQRIDQLSCSDEAAEGGSSVEKLDLTIKSLIKELRGLQAECENRSCNLLNDEPTRERARAAGSAYGYCILRLRYL